ncbi:hypothetical protein ACJX0J_013554 [Zea mays]
MFLKKRGNSAAIANVNLLSFSLTLFHLHVNLAYVHIRLIFLHISFHVLNWLAGGSRWSHLAVGDYQVVVTDFDGRNDVVVHWKKHLVLPKAQTLQTSAWFAAGSSL